MSTTLANPREVFNTRSSNGVGKEAEEVRAAISGVQQGILSSLSIGKPKRDAEENLYEVFGETCQPDWDGHGSASVSYDVYLKALEFLGRFPMNFPVPEVSADPDGEVSFEWYASPNWTFSISLGRGADLTYAGIFGANKTHGVEVFHGEIPESILNNIRRVSYGSQILDNG